MDRGPGRHGRAAQRRRRPPRPRRDRRRRSASPPRGPIRSRPSRSLTSRSRTARSPPAATPSAGSGSTADGTRTSSIRDRACRSSGSPRATVIAERSRRRRRLRQGLQRARARGEPAAGAVAPGRRVPDRREGRADVRGATAGTATSGRGRTGWRPPTSPQAQPRSPTTRPATRPGEAGRGQPPWNTDFELVVNFEINRPDGRGRAAIAGLTWPSGSRTRTGISVRTLSLWVSMGGAGPFQWLPDLKRWYAADQDRKLARQEGPVLHDRPADPPARQVQGHLGRQGRPRQAARRPASTRSASRPPASTGPIRASARQVTLADKPFTEELKGNVEIKSASIEYRRKAAAKVARRPADRPAHARSLRRRLKHPARQADALAAHLRVDVRPGGRAVLQRDRASRSTTPTGSSARPSARSRPRARSTSSGCTSTPAATAPTGTASPIRSTAGREAGGRRAPAEDARRSAGPWPTSGSTTRECTVTFKGPGYAADAFIDRESGHYNLTADAITASSP